MADNSTDIEQTVALYTAFIQIRPYAALAGVVLLVFDTLLTLSDEIDFIWRPKKRLVTLLYLFARYGGLLTLALNFVSRHPVFVLVSSLQTCTIISYFTSSLDAVTIFGIQSILMGRAYALAVRRRWMIALSFILFLSLQIINLGFVWFAPCDFSDYRVANIIDVLNDIILISSQAGLLSVTIYHTWHLRWWTQEYSRDRFRSLSGLVLQQEIIRFAVIFTWNFVGTIVDEVFSDSSFIGIDVPLEIAVNIILACRFTVQLRKQNFLAAEASIECPVIARQSICSHAFFSRIHDSITSAFGDNERMVNYTADEVEDVDGRRTSAVDGPTEVTLAMNEAPPCTLYKMPGRTLNKSNH